MSQPERMITLEVATKFHDQWDILPALPAQAFVATPLTCIYSCTETHRDARTRKLLLHAGCTTWWPATWAPAHSQVGSGLQVRSSGCPPHFRAHATST